MFQLNDKLTKYLQPVGEGGEGGGAKGQIGININICRSKQISQVIRTKTEGTSDRDWGGGLV